MARADGFKAPPPLVNPRRRPEPNRTRCIPGPGEYVAPWHAWRKDPRSGQEFPGEPLYKCFLKEVEQALE
eukprot:10925878-Prorocentrum_lima.AAC.1